MNQSPIIGCPILPAILSTFRRRSILSHSAGPACQRVFSSKFKLARVLDMYMHMANYQMKGPGNFHQEYVPADSIRSSLSYRVRRSHEIARHEPVGRRRGDWHFNRRMLRLKLAPCSRSGVGSVIKRRRASSRTRGPSTDRHHGVWPRPFLPFAPELSWATRSRGPGPAAGLDQWAGITMITEYQAGAAGFPSDRPQPAAHNLNMPVYLT